MDQRLWAIFAIICFALEGAGCAWMKRKPPGEVIVMPLQTGSAIQRRVVVPMEPGEVTKTSKKKKESKKTSKEKKESKRTSPKPSRAPEQPEDETPAAPDRLR